MKNVNLITVFLLCSAQAVIAQSVSIKEQMWSTENLKVTHFRNGDSIQQVITNEDWIAKGNAHEPAWCYYNNDSINNVTYGKLYNWYAVNDPRGLAPLGWHIPNYNEWMVLIDSQGGEAVAGSNLKAGTGWIGEGNGTNSSGFSGMPGGKRGSYGFVVIGELGRWWSSEGTSSQSSWAFGFGSKDSRAIGIGSDNSLGLSVRCLKD